MGTAFMTTENASAIRCIKVGAGYACIWAAGFACLLGIGGLELRDVDHGLGEAILIGSLAVVAVGIPVLRDARFRNPGAVFFLVLGALVVSALLAVLAAFAFLIYIFLGSGGRGHR
jgi:predicted membrane channel-forming protein YqfA (hemolysin III family)